MRTTTRHSTPAHYATTNAEQEAAAHHTTSCKMRCKTVILLAITAFAALQVEAKAELFLGSCTTLRSPGCLNGDQHRDNKHSWRSGSLPGNFDHRLREHHHHRSGAPD